MAEEYVEDTAAPQDSQLSPEEQQAVERYRESQKTEEERASGMPEGYNEDGTAKEELIDGKFKSQEDLLKAYHELQNKLSTPRDSTADVQDEPKTEQAAEETQLEDKDGNTFSTVKYEEEVASNGSLSDESYSELEKKGFTRQQVDAYIQGQQAYGESIKTQIYDFVGGQDEYLSVIEWAGANMPEDVIQRYNNAVDSLDRNAIQQTLEYMALKKQMSEPKQARRLEGDAPATGIQPFRDKAEWQREMSNRLYGKDAKYTNMVDQRYLAARRKGLL